MSRAVDVPGEQDDGRGDRSREDTSRRLRRRLEQGPPVVLDGAGGTALADEGVNISGKLWSAQALVSDREKVVRLHEAYLRSGAEVLTTQTFRTHPFLFKGQGGEQAWRETLRAAVDAAEEGIRRAGVDRDGVWIAGSTAPVGDCYTPQDVPGDDVLIGQHTKQAEGLADAGVDLILVETMLMVREAEAAAAAAKATGLPFWVSFVVGPDARLLSGEPLQEAMEAAEGAGADVVLVNCASLEDTTAAVRVLKEHARGPWGAYANGSRGDPMVGWGERVDVPTYAAAAREWSPVGARVVGSCCATTPGFTRAIARIVRFD